MKILIAEDEKRMANALSKLLSQEGYDIDCVNEGLSALFALEKNSYDAAILDVMMPEINGFTVVSKARKKGILTPIILLTAKSETEDKVMGLDCGADDYLTKPFQAKELLARLRALCRRNTNYQNDSSMFGDLLLDISTATLKCVQTKQSIRIGEKELHILEYMFANQNRIISREQLTIHIWGYDNDSEYNNVEVYMSFTRKKLDFIGSKVEIKAVRNLGYELRYKGV